MNIQMSFCRETARRSEEAVKFQQKKRTVIGQWIYLFEAGNEQTPIFKAFVPCSGLHNFVKFQFVFFPWSS